MRLLCERFQGALSSLRLCRDTLNAILRAWGRVSAELCVLFVCVCVCVCERSNLLIPASLRLKVSLAQTLLWLGSESTAAETSVCAVNLQERDAGDVWGACKVNAQARLGMHMLLLLPTQGCRQGRFLPPADKDPSLSKNNNAGHTGG